MESTWGRYDTPGEIQHTLSPYEPNKYSHDFNLGVKYIVKVVDGFHRNVDRLTPERVYEALAHTVGHIPSNLTIVRTNDGKNGIWEAKNINAYTPHTLGSVIKYIVDNYPSKSEMDTVRREQTVNIYEDGLIKIVAPQSYASSCMYGAGTRWCTTSKESDRHFKRETDKRALVYVLSKSIDSNNPTYKVAWQIPYTRKINKILSIDDVNLNKVKFWDAEDISMGDRYPSLTTEYFSTLPIGLKSAIVDYTQKMMDEYYQGVGFSEDPNMQALVQHLNIPQDNIQDIDKMDFTNFGMSIYVYDDYGYTVASESGVDNARAMWADDFFDSSSFDDAISILGGNYSDYIYITDTHGIATDMADSIISDLSDEDLLDEAKRSRDREVKELLEDYMISSGTESDFDDDEEELEEKFSKEEITPSEYTAELDRIQKERKELSVYLDNKLKTIREILRGLIKREYEDEMSNYPVRWLKDFGWWEDNKPTKKAFELDIVSLDEDAIKSDLENILDLDYFSTTGNYYSTIVDGERYYIFPTDI